MNSTLQPIHDLAMIVRTDRRVWSAGAFIVGVFFIWFVTAGWREPELDEGPTKKKWAPPQNDYVAVLVGDMHQQIKKQAETRRQLSDFVGRTVSELEIDKQKTDWHVNTLMDRLNTMTMRVDKLTRDIGERRLSDARLAQKINAGRKKPQPQKQIPEEE